MQITWRDLSFLPSETALAALNDAWAWLLPPTFEPILASTLGDVFFLQGTPDVYWLNTGTADISRVAGSRDEFLELLRTEQADEWFLPHVIEELHAAGKRLQPDHCYTYVTLPIFEEGSYSVANLNPVPAAEHFAVTGDIHRQIRHLPDGAKVKLKVT